MEKETDPALLGEVVSGTPIDRYRQRLLASTITLTIATQTGVRLCYHPDNGYEYILLPYYDVDGEDTGFWRGRYLDDENVKMLPRERGPKQSTGFLPGKYFQSKGSTNHLYWPIAQRAEFGDTTVPLFIVEGEFKAIATKFALMGAGIRALVCGVPGTTISKAVSKELRAIPCSAAEARRPVYICMDWNARGQPKERADKAETDIANIFHALGASPLLFRWPIPEKAGEQKIDDWLAAGGDIGEALRHTEEEKDVAEQIRELICADIRKRYCMIGGQFHTLRGDPVPNVHFDNDNGHLYMAEGKRRVTARAIFTGRPPSERNEVVGLLFHPCPVGWEPEQYVWKDGKRYLNIAPKWPEYDVPPYAEPCATHEVWTLFEHVFCEHSTDVLRFVKHTMIDPLDRPHKVIHINGPGGTGKSTVISVLEVLFGQLARPIGSALTTKFSDPAKNILVGLAPDTPVHGRDVDAESTVKALSGDDTVEFTRKGKDAAASPNYLRLWITYNRIFFVPVTPDDRRHVMFRSEVPLSPDFVADLKRLLRDPLYAWSLRQNILAVELGDFNPHKWMPRTDARIIAESRSTPRYGKFMAETEWEKDIYTNEDIMTEWRRWLGDARSSAAPSEVLKDLQQFGLSPCRIIKHDKVTKKFRSVRNTAKWELADNAAWKQEYESVKTTDKYVP